MKTTLHEIPLERRTLHGHFSRDLEPVAEVFTGDVIRFATLDAGWGVEPPRPDGSERRRFEPLDPELDTGHPLIGPVAVRNARAGMTLEVRIETVRVGEYGLTVAGGWSTPLNDRLGVGSGESRVLSWELDADAGTARDGAGREVSLAPFLGVLGMPPPEPGVHPTGPPRAWGGNLDCKELVAGTTLYLPIPVEGALFSAGDGHARQGDGEVSSTAIECPLERAELGLGLREDFELTTPLARTRDSWIALGLGESLDEAMGNAVEAMLAVMGRELGLERREALALASVVVDLRITQVVNGVQGVHAVLPDGAIRRTPRVAYEFKLPDLGEGLTEGEIARWLVSEGQHVAEDDPLVEIQTDKTTVEIPSPAAGKVARILVGEGEVVPVGTVLVVIGEDGVAPADEQPRAAPATSVPEVAGGQSLGRGQTGRVRATPLVRRMADELGVDLTSVEATGPQGRVTEEDVRRAADRGLSLGHVPEGRREPLRGVRRLVAEHMARAHREVPPVTWVEECDFGAVELSRLVPTVLKAAAESLKEFPELNARLEGDQIVYLDRYDLGVAVQTDQGLVVPVVRGCDTASPDELAQEVDRLAEAARTGTLKPEELRGSTFTVTSAGKLGGLLTTPIVNHPEVAILSIGRIAERPVVRDGEIQARPVGTIAITFDHRVIDGARAAEFGLAVIRRLEQG